MASRVRCSEHPDAPLVEDHHAGDVICTACGKVIGDRVIDVGSEWRTFSNDKATSDPSRVGSSENPLLGSSDLSTIIGPSTSANAFGQDGQAIYRNHRNVPSSERALISAFREISDMSDRINLPRTIVERAQYLYKQVQDGRSLKGRSSSAIASACLFIACRQENVPRSFKEICAVSRVPKKEIGRCFKIIIKSLSIETTVEQSTSGDYMARFCSNLSLPPPVQRAATHIARRAVDLDLVRGNPISVAAAAIYMACQATNTKKSAKEIADAVGVGEATINLHCKVMEKHAGKLFPEGFQPTVA